MSTATLYADDLIKHLTAQQAGTFSRWSEFSLNEVDQRVAINTYFLNTKLFCLSEVENTLFKRKFQYKGVL